MDNEWFAHSGQTAYKSQRWRAGTIKLLIEFVLAKACVSAANAADRCWGTGHIVTFSSWAP